MIYVFYIYTVIIFSFVIYLSYLRYYDVVKYTNIQFNLHFYVFILYVSLFLVSATLTFCVYSLQAAGAGLAEIFKSLDLESIDKGDLHSVHDSPAQERSGEEKVHTPNEKGSEKWVSNIVTGFKERVKGLGGVILKDGFVKSTNELSANNQKVAITKLEPFVTQENTQPASKLGVNTGNIKAPYYCSAVKQENGGYNLLECSNFKTAIEMYDEGIKNSGAQNKFGPIPRLGIKISSLCGLDYSKDQCIEVSIERCRKALT